MRLSQEVMFESREQERLPSPGTNPSRGTSRSRNTRVAGVRREQQSHAWGLQAASVADAERKENGAEPGT
jgi:hypothetical protein